MQLAVAGQNTWCSPASHEDYCESQQTYFSYSLDKAFHLLEFQANYFSRAIQCMVLTETDSEILSSVCWCRGVKRTVGFFPERECIQTIVM